MTKLVFTFLRDHSAYEFRLKWIFFFRSVDRELFTDFRRLWIDIGLSRFQFFAFFVLIVNRWTKSPISAMKNFFIAFWYRCLFGSLQDGLRLLILRLRSKYLWDIRIKSVIQPYIYTHLTLIRTQLYRPFFWILHFVFCIILCLLLRSRAVSYSFNYSFGLNIF